jgi:hypothetical protein
MGSLDGKREDFKDKNIQFNTGRGLKSMICILIAGEAVWKFRKACLDGGR